VSRKLGDRGILTYDGHFYAARPIELLGLESQGGVVRSGISMYTTAADVQRLVDGVAAVAKG
jgi:selenocysteine lyase/cysteine desulfurase